jgi:hypothetical protein
MKSLHVNWAGPPIDIEGLNPGDRKRIAEIGLSRWLEEVSRPKIKLTGKFLTGLPVQKKEKDQTALTEVVLDQRQAQKISIGKKGNFLADEFIRIARANNGIVTVEECKKVNPQYPADVPYYARLRGCQVETDRKNKLYKLVKK